MKKYVIFAVLEASFSKVFSYEAEEIQDKNTGMFSHLYLAPHAIHALLPSGMDEDVVKPVLVPEVPEIPHVPYRAPQDAIPAQPEKWTKEGEADVFEQPMMEIPVEDGEEGETQTVPDTSWTYVAAQAEVPAVTEIIEVPYVPGVPAYYVCELVPALVQAKALAMQEAYIDKVLDDAMAFGSALQKKFTKQNIVMGITAEGKTGDVRKAMTEVIVALQTGSLYDAITEAKAIPAEAYDAKYITAPRLISFINEIEEYLNLPLSTEL